MDSTHRKSIPNTVGLLVYDSTTKSFWYNNGNIWQNIATSLSGWSLKGNSGIDTSKNFLGTTDRAPLIFRVNNAFAGKIGDGAVSLGEGAYLNNQNPANMILTAIGIGALHNNKTDPNIYSSGYLNTAVGGYALYYNTTGQNNTAVGSYALNQSTTGRDNTAAGASALQQNSTGSNNAAFGSGALNQNRIGTDNTALGEIALAFNKNGSYNTAVGSMTSINSNTSGNTAIGANALKNNFDGSNNTALGYNSDIPTLAQGISNATAIGANAKVNASNKIRLGDAYITAVESNGVFNTVSDGRFKYNIREDVKGLDFILQLRPVTYQFDTRKQEEFIKGSLSAEQLNSHTIPVAFTESNSIKRTGFIAQEVAGAAKKAGFNFDGVKIPATDQQYYSLSYASFVVPLVKAVQEQQQLIDDLKRQNERLKQQNDMIIRRLEALEKK